MILAFIFLVVETALLLLSPIAFIVFHLVAIGFLALLCYKARGEVSFLYLLLIALIAAPIFGPLGILFLGFLMPIFTRYAYTSAEWLKDLFLDAERTAETTTFQRIQVGWDDYGSPQEIAAFKDIFTYGTLVQKQAVLDAVVKDFRPVYAPILKEALVAPSNTMRLQAAAIVAKISGDFEELLARSEDPLEKAKAIERFASYPWIEPARQKDLLEESAVYYKIHLEKNPDSKATVLAIGRIYFMEGNDAAFIQWYEQFAKQYKEIPTLIQNWYKEAIHRTKK